MQKVFRVIAHCSNGDVNIAPAGMTYCETYEEALAIVEGHKVLGVDIEIVPIWDDVPNYYSWEEFDVADLTWLLEEAANDGLEAFEFCIDGNRCEVDVNLESEEINIEVETLTENNAPGGAIDGHYYLTGSVGFDATVCCYQEGMTLVLNESYVAEDVCEALSALLDRIAE